MKERIIGSAITKRFGLKTVEDADKYMDKFISRLSDGNLLKVHSKYLRKYTKKKSPENKHMVLYLEKKIKERDL